jgi:hypothetical protein
MRHCQLILSLGALFICAQPVRANFINEVLGDNPAGFWVLNDAPGPTTTAVDSSFASFNGTYGTGVTPQGTAGPSWVPGAGLVADFTNGTISFPGALNLGANGYTIEAWINPTLASLQNPSRIAASSANGLDGYAFGTTAGGELVFTSYTVQDYLTTTVTLLPNQWYYVGVVLDTSDNAHFYVNGALVQTVAGTVGGTDTPTGNFTLGNNTPGVLAHDEPFTGGVAGVSVYNTALTPSQIQAQFNAAAIPEPSALGLSSLAALGVGCIRWRVWRGRTSGVGKR